MIYPKYECIETFTSVLEDGSTGLTIVNPGDVLQYYGRCGGEYPEFKTQFGYYIHVKPEDVERRMRLLPKTKDDVLEEVKGLLDYICKIETDVDSLRQKLASILNEYAS